MICRWEGEELSLTRCLGPLILSWADGKPRASGPFTTASRSSLLSQTEAPRFTRMAPNGPIWLALRNSVVARNPDRKTAGVWTIHDGFPLQFVVTNGGTPIYTYGSQRPNLVGTPEFSGGPESNWINNYFANPNVFQAPAPYTLGNAPRTVGTVRTPFFFSTNLSILKEFAVVPSHEQMKLELRLEAQNAFNHPVFGTPDTYVGDPNR